jgi:hypothetical protein
VFIGNGYLPVRHILECFWDKYALKPCGNKNITVGWLGSSFVSKLDWWVLIYVSQTSDLQEE